MKKMSELLRELAPESQKCLEQIVDKAVWDRLDRSVRIGTLTSEMCIRSLGTIDNGVDYSAAVMPLMKVLENELTNRFYLPYKAYLRRTYTPDEYININHLERLQMNPEDARKKVLHHNNSGYVYCRDYARDGVVKFTLGNFQYTAGVDNLSVKECDETTVRFYMQSVFGTDSDYQKVKEWICNLAIKVESLVRLRNDSAHAGIIQSKIDANTAMDKLIKNDKILLGIIYPSLE